MSCDFREQVKIAQVKTQLGIEQGTTRDLKDVQSRRGEQQLSRLLQKRSFREKLHAFKEVTIACFVQIEQA